MTDDFHRISAATLRDARPHLRLALDLRLERSRGRRHLFELARLMGTSVRMIEKHYGTLLEGAHAGLVTRLDSLEADARWGGGHGRGLGH